MSMSGIALRVPSGNASRIYDPHVAKVYRSLRYGCHLSPPPGSPAGNDKHERLLFSAASGGAGPKTASSTACGIP